MLLRFALLLPFASSAYSSEFLRRPHLWLFTLGRPDRSLACHRTSPLFIFGLEDSNEIASAYCTARVNQNMVTPHGPPLG